MSGTKLNPRLTKRLYEAHKDKWDFKTYTRKVEQGFGLLQNTKEKGERLFEGDNLWLIRLALEYRQIA